MRAVKILERVLTVIPIMFGVAIIVFLFMRLTPGDPVDIMMGSGGAVSAGEMEQLRHEFHLDEPLHVQLWLFLKDAVRGDLGYSYVQKRPVTELIAERLPATIELALGALFFALLVAIPIGIYSAVRQYSLTDRLGMAGAFVGVSMPAFWSKAVRQRRLQRPRPCASSLSWNSKPLAAAADSLSIGCPSTLA